MRAEIRVRAQNPLGLSIAYLFDESDTSEVAQFMLEQRRHHQNDYTKVMALFARVAQAGLPENREKVKKVEGDIWEFKSHQVRILWFRDTSAPGTLVCVSAERKKRDDLSPATIRRAQEGLTKYKASITPTMRRNQ